MNSVKKTILGLVALAMVTAGSADAQCPWNPGPPNFNTPYVAGGMTYRYNSMGNTGTWVLTSSSINTDGLCFPGGSMTDPFNVGWGTDTLTGADTSAMFCQWKINGTATCRIRGGDGLPVELLHFGVE